MLNKENEQELMEMSSDGAIYEMTTTYHNKCSYISFRRKRTLYCIEEVEDGIYRITRYSMRTRRNTVHPVYPIGQHKLMETLRKLING